MEEPTTVGPEIYIVACLTQSIWDSASIHLIGAYQNKETAQQKMDELAKDIEATGMPLKKEDNKGGSGYTSGNVGLVLWTKVINTE